MGATWWRPSVILDFRGGWWHRNVPERTVPGGTNVPRRTVPGGTTESEVRGNEFT